MTGRIISVAAVLLVAIGLSAGFLLTGSPQHAREVAFDDRRVEDLLAIARSFVDAKLAETPRSLSALESRTHSDGSSITLDPLTHRPYRYVRLDRTHYRLCATFAVAGDDGTSDERRLPHRAGSNCFDFDIHHVVGVPAEPGPVVDLRFIERA